MAPLMAGQPPVVRLLAAVGLATSCNPLRREIPMESGIRPDPSTPPFPVLFLNSRPLPPAVRLWWFIAAPIISTIPIHLLRCTTITPAATTTNLLLPPRSTAAATATSRCPGPRCRCRGGSPFDIHPVVVCLPDPAASTNLSLPSRPTATGTTSRAPTMCPAWVETPLHCSRQLGRPSAAATGPSPPPRPTADSASLPPLTHCCLPR